MSNELTTSLASSKANTSIARWYAVQVASSCEKKVKATLEQKINIAIDKKVINKIANDSYEPEYGARPLSRELRRQIENPLAAKLLEDNFKNKKNITIKLNPSKKDEIVFKPS